MKLVVGLGNPGAVYEDTRHNVGFRVLEALRKRYDLPGFTTKFKGLTSKGRIDGEDVVLLLPQTFMNLSGQSVQPAAAFYKIAPHDTLVVHDELDLEPCQLRWKLGGGDAGHNGLKSITQLLGTANYQRLRFGIGRPVNRQQVSDYVLRMFDVSEQPALDTRIGTLVEAFGDILRDPQKAVARVNGL